MDDEALRAMVRTRLQKTPLSRELCPAIEALQAAASRPGDSAEHLQLFEHVAACSECRRDFDLLRTVEAAALAAPSRARVAGWMPALAAAVLLIGVSVTWLRTPGEADDVTRGTAATAAVRLQPPLIVGDTAVTLRWSAVEQALRYRVEITTASGALVSAQETRDTLLLLALPKERELRWSVSALLLNGVELVSGNQPLTSPR